ncbi:hypothetical protein BJN42_08120 [Pseudomonas koreensis]|nr:hypothetical protein BJN42_08120 [Pseudomonas koreensis]
MVSNLVVIGFLVRMVKGLCVRVQLLKAGFGRLSNARFMRICGECEVLFASRLAPTTGMRFPVGASLLAKRRGQFGRETFATGNKKPTNKVGLM